MVTKKLKGLGRGLEALLGPTAPGEAALNDTPTGSPGLPASLVPDAVVIYSCRLLRRPGSEKDITEVSGTSSPGSIPGRGTLLFTARDYLLLQICA